MSGCAIKSVLFLLNTRTLRGWVAGAILLGALVAGAEAGSVIYQWRDDQGALHFTDNPDTVPVPFRGPLTGSAQKVLPNEKNEKRSTRVSLDQNHGAVLVPVMFNNRHRLSLFLDTGATYCQIRQEDVRALDLDIEGRPPVRVLTADGRIMESPMVILDSVRIGSLEIDKVEALVGDVPLLGLNALQRFRLTLDIAQGEIILESSNP